MEKDCLLLPIDINVVNISEMKNIPKVNCEISSEEIINFANLPIGELINYTLYHLNPVPALYDSKFIKIIPNVR